jgi:peptidoglycan/LPS O-acetylase OafA/YrhL
MRRESEVSSPAVVATPNSHERYLAVRTFGSLDGLRAVSILMVLWHHTPEHFPRWPIAQRGFLGVDLFFTISGFLIVTLLLREQRRTGTTSLRKFYIRRFLRIFPPYYAMLAFVGAAAFLRPGGNASAGIRHDLPYALLYVANLVPMASMLAITWSLAVEEQFYMAVPVLQKHMRRRFPLAVAIAYVAVSLPPFGYLPQVPFPEFFRSTTFGPILLGVMLAIVLDHARGYRWVSSVLGHWGAPLASLALVLLACSHPAPDISGWPRLAIQWSLLLLVASCVVTERHAAAPILRLWPLQRIGAVSYGIYLYHLLVRHAVDWAMRASGVSSILALFVVTGLASWAVAELSLRHFESRFLALKARWT